MRYRLAALMIGLLALVLITAPSPIPVQAQGGETCPQLVVRALAETGTNCANLPRNTACYGFNRVDATFAETVPADFFSQVADRAGLTSLSTIETADLNSTESRWGIAVLNVQADIPNTLPGQTTTFLLLGDVEVTNEVAPEDALPVVEPVAVVTAAEVTLRSAPARNANVVETVTAGSDLLADGVSPDGAWLRVGIETGSAWVPVEALAEGLNLGSLPAINRETFTPMQAFSFRTGFGAPECVAAPPSVLVVQGPEDIAIDIRANGADIRVGSILFLRTLPNNMMQIVAGFGQAILFPETIYEIVVPAGTSVEVPLGPDGQVLHGDEWERWRLQTQAELDQYDPIENVPGNLVPYPYEGPTLVQPSGIGAPPPWVDTPGGPVYPVPPLERLFARINMFITETGTALTRAPWEPITIGAEVCPAWVMYHSDRDGDWDIYRLGDPRGDMSDLGDNVTQGPGSSDIQPSFSADAEWVAYTSDRDGVGNWEIYIAAVDGSVRRRVTYNTAVDVNPAWGPDSRIIFESTRDGNWELYLVDVSGGGEPTRLTDNPASDINAFWSPDGATVYFQSDRDGDWDIYVLELASGVITQITKNDSEDVELVVSHDGALLAWLQQNSFGVYDLIIMDIASGEVTQLTDLGADVLGPVFSPDDSFIAFSSNVDGDFDLFAVELATGLVKAVTENDVEDRAPGFWCDGPIMVYHSATADSENPGQLDIYEASPLPFNGPPSPPARLITDEDSDDLYPAGEVRNEFNSREGRTPEHNQ